MTIIALTGGIGSGKSEASRLFAAHGVPIVDTDIIAHQLTAPNAIAIQPIIETFGNEFINNEGGLNRTKMRAHVFNNPEARVALESIMHPLIRADVLRNIDNNKQTLSKLDDLHYQMVIVPLLFESHYYQTIVDRVCVVDCDPELQISRATHRSNIDEKTVKSIMEAQVSRAMRLEKADDIITNNGSLEALKTKINTFHLQFNEFCFKLASARNPSDNNS